jgi:hypothetical protein
MLNYKFVVFVLKEGANQKAFWGKDCFYEIYELLDEDWKGDGKLMVFS